MTGGFFERAGGGLLILLAAGWLATGCTDDGDDGVISGPPTTVVFDYFEAIERDVEIAKAHTECVVAVGKTHIHPSWKGFKLHELEVVDGHWQVTFDNVPTGSLQRIRISDPNACDRDRCGASTRNVFANGVELNRVVDTPGGCIFTSTSPAQEPGLAFTVDEAGTVTP